MSTHMADENLPSGLGMTSGATVMQLNRESLEAITRGVVQGLLQTERDTSTSPGDDRTQSTSSREQGKII